LLGAPLARWRVGAIALFDVDKDLVSGQKCGDPARTIRRGLNTGGLRCSDGCLTKRADCRGVLAGLCLGDAAEHAKMPFPAWHGVLTFALVVMTSRGLSDERHCTLLFYLVSDWLSNRGDGDFDYAGVGDSFIAISD